MIDKVKNGTTLIVYVSTLQRGKPAKKKITHTHTKPETICIRHRCSRDLKCPTSETHFKLMGQNLCCPFTLCTFSWPSCVAHVDFFENAQAKAQTHPWQLQRSFGMPRGCEIWLERHANPKTAWSVAWQTKITFMVSSQITHYIFSNLIAARSFQTAPLRCHETQRDIAMTAKGAIFLQHYWRL